MSLNAFKNVSRWFSLVAAAISAGAMSFVKWTFIFDSGNVAGTLVLVSVATAVLAITLGTIILPRWQGFVALAAFGYVTYCFLFTPLYALT